jgi:hypothetical protein
MRALALVVLVLAATQAHANGFAELVGGLSIPVADNDWTNYVDSSPKLGVRVGAVQQFGAMLSADWTPINTNEGWAVPGASADVTASRFRILVNGLAHAKIAPKLIASARFGLGIDITHVSVTTNILGAQRETTDTDSGIALEPAVGLWVALGSLHIGGELALPISFHSDDSSDDIDMKLLQRRRDIGE